LLRSGSQVGKEEVNVVLVTGALAALAGDIKKVA
jgi:hypothetical protein